MANETKEVAATPASSASAKPAGKKGNKMILIIVAVLIGLCILCSGIGFVLSVALNKAEDEIEDSIEDINEEAIEDEIEDSLEENFGDDADVDFGIDGDADLPEDFPSDVELPDDSKIVSSSRIASDSGDGYDFTVIAQVEGSSANEIVEEFQDNLEDEGWTLDSEIAIFGSTVIYTKNGRTLTVIAFDGYETEEQDASFTLTIVND